MSLSYLSLINSFDVTCRRSFDILSLILKHSEDRMHTSEHVNILIGTYSPPPPLSFFSSNQFPRNFFPNMLTFVSSSTLQGNKQDLNAQRVVQRDEAEKFASGESINSHNHYNLITRHDISNTTWIT